MTNSIDTSQSSPANQQMSRRSVLRIGCVGTLVAAAGAAGILSQTEFFDRIRGITDMPLLDDETAWQYADGTLTVALEKVAALQQPGSAVRLESDSLPEDLLIVRSSSDDYYVFVNACTHSGRKIDLTTDGQVNDPPCSGSEPNGQNSGVN